MKATWVKWSTVAASALAATCYSRAQTAAGSNIQDLRFYAGVSYAGEPGVAYELQYSTNLQDSGGWITLTNVILDTDRLFFVDLDSSLNAKRFYRLREVSSGVASGQPGNAVNGSRQSILSSSVATTNWGVLVDPDHDCYVWKTNDVIRLEVPGTAHDFASELARWNAPRILTNVDGNFILEVRVSGNFRPGEESTIDGRRPYHGAGLLLVQDRTNHLSLQRGAVLMGNRVKHYANFELRHGPEAEVLNYEWDIEDKDIMLRVARTGNRILAMTSQDGVNWRAFNPITVDFGSALSVGVEAVSSSQTPLSCTFKGLALYRAVEGEGGVKGLNVTGTWRWVQGGGQFQGKMDLVQTAEGRITGRMYDTTGGLEGTISGAIVGNAIQFTRTWGANERQYHLTLDGEKKMLTGKLSGVPDSSIGVDFSASR
jgi:regulation of enolase protein 1 (concanavalin A-like superfamily)